MKKEWQLNNLTIGNMVRLSLDAMTDAFKDDPEAMRLILTEVEAWIRRKQLKVK